MTTKPVTDRDVDPVLAAHHELYGLMLAARRDPGEKKVRAFPADMARELSECAEGHDFVATLRRHETTSDLIAITVTWPGGKT